MSDPMPAKAHEFTIKVEGLALNAEAQARISVTLQKAFLGALADLDLTDKPGIAFLGDPRQGGRLRVASRELFG